MLASARRCFRTLVVGEVVLGRAARSLWSEPRSWQDWAAPDETLQHIKQLWHVLVAFGHPRELRRIC